MQRPVSMAEATVAERVAELLSRAESFARADDPFAARGCARQAVEEAERAGGSRGPELEGEARLALARHAQALAGWQLQATRRGAARVERERAATVSKGAGP